jgi:hypothetical protein
MGTWGTGPFDNDAAMDLVNELAQKPSAVEVTMALRSAMVEVVKNKDYVDGPEMAAAIAAACLVATQLDPSLPLDATVINSLGGVTFNVEGLRELGERVFMRADDPAANEWYDLAADAGDLGDVEAANAPYRTALVSRNAEKHCSSNERYVINQNGLDAF